MNAEIRDTLKPWQDSQRDLVNVAMGRKPADLVVRDGRWVNVHSGEIIDGTDLAVIDGRFAYCGPDAGHCIGEDTVVVDAGGRYLVPGLCDAHMHIESGMLTVTEFVRAVVPHGTTSMFVDPHEIANVLGLDGVRMMHDEALMQPVNIFTQMPSCAPSAPGLETPGAELGPEDVADAGDMTGAGARHDFVVSVLSGSEDGGGFGPVKAAAAAVVAALEDGALTLEHGHLAGLWFVAARARRSDGGAGRRVDMTFRARIDLGLNAA